jgi:hypothetical protein
LVRSNRFIASVSPIRVAEVLPLVYLHGLSSSDFGPVLEQFLGSGAGLSAATITWLTAQWQDDAEAFNKRSLNDIDYVYLWVDGIHLKVRLEQDKVCLLVMIGVGADGTNELGALADGFRDYRDGAVAEGVYHGINSAYPQVAGDFGPVRGRLRAGVRFGPKSPPDAGVTPG